MAKPYVEDGVRRARVSKPCMMDVSTTMKGTQEWWGFPPSKTVECFILVGHQWILHPPQFSGENCLFGFRAAFFFWKCQEAADGVDGAEGGKGWRLC